MNRTFDSIIEAVSELSSAALDRSAERLVVAEKEHIAELICHLAEIATRKAHLEWGYGSLFEYCVKRLNLSEGSVAMRIQVARVAHRVPEILPAHFP